MLEGHGPPITGAVHQRGEAPMQDAGDGLCTDNGEHRFQPDREAGHESDDGCREEHRVQRGDPACQLRLHQEPRVEHPLPGDEQQRQHVEQVLDYPLGQRRVDSVRERDAGGPARRRCNQGQGDGQHQAPHGDEPVTQPLAVRAAGEHVGELGGKVEPRVEEPERAGSQGEHGEFGDRVRVARQRAVLELNREHHRDAGQGERPVEAPVFPQRASSCLKALSQ